MIYHIVSGCSSDNLGDTIPNNISYLSRVFQGKIGSTLQQTMLRLTRPDVCRENPRDLVLGRRSCEERARNPA